MAPSGKPVTVLLELRAVPLRSRLARWTAWDQGVFALVVAVFVAARLYRIAAICLDGDEIFSVGVSSKSWTALNAAAGADAIHPPLFYYLLKLWMYLGSDSLFWTRLLPAIFCILAIIPTVLLARELRLRPAEINGVVALASIHPFLLYYSQHVRMYTLLMLCALTSLWLFRRAIRSGSPSATTIRYVQLTLANVVLVYSQYYGWLVIGLEGLYLLLWKRAHWKRMAISAAVTLAAFYPWLRWAAHYAIAKGGLGSNLEWIQKPGVGDLTWFFVDLAGFSEFPEIGPRVVAGLGLLVLAMSVAAWLNRKSLRSTQFAYMTRFLSFFLLGTVGIAFGASRVMHNSIWGHRHMIYLAIPFLMILAGAYSRLPARSVRVTGALLCAAWAFLAIQHHWKGDDKKTPYDALVVHLLDEEKTTAGQIKFFSVDKYLHYPVWFYLETLKAGRKTGFAAPIRDADVAALGKEAARFEVKNNVPISAVQGSHFWVGYSSAWDRKVLPEEVMTQRGCRTGLDFKVRDRYHSMTIFPVWCGS